jgi:Fatty acid desaturase
MNTALSLRTISGTSHKAQDLPNTPLSIRDRIYQRVLTNSVIAQALITEITGCPHTGQKPLLWLSNSHYITLYLTAFLGGIVLAWMGWQKSCLLLIFVGWVLTLGGCAGSNFGLIHQAAHGNLTGYKGVDRWLGRVLSVLILLTDFDQYDEGYSRHHSVKTHQTAVDNTLKLLAYVGIQPGLPIERCWQALVCLVNPFFLGKFLFQKRLALVFIKSYTVSKVLAILIWGGVFAGVLLTHAEMPFLVAYGVPVAVLYSPLYVIRHFVEHKLPSAEVYQNRDKTYVALSTDAVFLGEVPPPKGLTGIAGGIAWTGWWLRLLFWHGMWRWLVCPYDVPVHDYHTRMAGNPREDAAHAIWHRQAQQKAGCPGWPTPYTEVWGFVNAMRTVLTSFSEFPQDESL